MKQDQSPTGNGKHGNKRNSKSILTRTTNTKWNDMGMFGWNESKLARIAELEEQIRALQEIRESLLHEVERIQGEFMVMRGIVDESREGVEQHRNIADQLEKERDDLKVQLETRTNQVGFLKNRMANLTHDIIAGLTTIQVRKSITRALVDLDKLDSK